jgi:4-alpha-glucanotransferase
MTERELLEKAANAYGIEPGYTDVFGRVHETSEHVARLLLRSFGVPADSAESLAQSLANQEAARWRRGLDETLVVREHADAIELRIPASRNGGTVKLEIQWENGDPQHPDIQHHWFWLPELTVIASANVQITENLGTEYLAKRVPLPKPLRLGYHRVRVYWVTHPGLELFAEAHFIVCPERVKSVDRRMAGIGVSLYGLRSARNWGCGDFTDLRAVIDAFAPAGAAFVALNPLHAIANRAPYNTSPYLPQCAFYRNFIYLDVEKCGKIDLDESLAREIEALRASEFVEYERVAELKLRALSRVFDEYFRDECSRDEYSRDASPASADFEAFIEREGRLLDDYAVYCALDEEMHRRDPNVWLWTQWPEEYREPRLLAVREFARGNYHRVRFYKFLQWQLSRQAAEAHAYALEKGMAIGLFHDLALATDRYGCDLWANRPFYNAHCRSGAPPDELAPHGQDWGFPPPDRDAHRKNGYALFAQSIRKAAEWGGALRIDHVMRVFRLYTIPEEVDATHGAYVRDNANDLIGVLALESARGNFVVVGEDLGTVTGEVRESLAAAGVLSYRLLWFERDDEGKFRHPHEYPSQALAAATTHDLPTLAGFAIGRDIEARRSAGLVDDAEHHRQWEGRHGEMERLNQALAEAGFSGDPLGFVLATPCQMAVLNQEDLSGETEQQNLPGSTWQYPNWRRKMRVAVSELLPLAERFGDAVRKSGRVPSPAIIDGAGPPPER